MKKMKQNRTTLKKLTERYRVILLKCALINMAFCPVAEAASISDATDGTNRYIGSFGVPLKVYNSDSSIGTYYAVSSDLMGNAAISGVTATLNNASRVGSGNLSWTQSTGLYAEVSNSLSESQKSSSVNNIAAVLSAMNDGDKNYNALPDGIKQALNVPFDGSQSIAEYLQTTWPGSGADISTVRAALNAAYATFNSDMTTPAAWDKAVSITNSTLTLNGTSAIVNRSKYSPASDGNIAVSNSTITANGTNALIAHTGITFADNSNLNVSQGATLTVTSSGNLVSLTDSNLTLNGAITSNVSLDGTVALSGTGTISGNLNVAASSVLDMQNDAIDAISAGTVTGGNFSVALDVNAVGGTIDRFTATSFTTGTITISDLNFLSAERNFALNVLNGNATGATLVLSSAVSAAYNTSGSTEEWRNNLVSTATWATAFTKTRYTIETSKSLTVLNNKTLQFTVTNGEETEHETVSLGDTMKLLNTMDSASRTMTNSTSVASYAVAENLGTTAEGTFTINGAKTDSSAATINMAGYTGFSVGSDATLNLQNIVFSGNTVADGSVLTVAGGSAGLSNVTIGNAVSVTSGALTLSGGNSLGGLVNAGTVTLTGANGIGAMSGAGTLTNSGNLTLNGTTNAQIIGGTGRTYINAALTTTAAINQAITINSGKTLTANATLIGGAVTNGGTLALTGGTLGRTVSGGAVQIAGNVVSNVDLSNVTISSGNKLTIGAGNVGSGFTNNGTVVLTGGEISNPLSGNITVTGFTEMKNGADFSGAQINLNEGILDIGENTLTANMLTGGIVSLDLKEYAAVGSPLITATPSGAVTLEVWPISVTNKAVQHYTLTSTNNGYSLEFILSPFFAVSTTPFDKSDAMNIAAFDASAWHGGDLYVVALNVAEIAVSELAKNGYEVTVNDKNTTKKLADDLEDILTGQYQDNYQKINMELLYGFIDEDYERVKAILAEAGTDTTLATVQTAQINAQAVMSVISSRLGGGSAVKGRSGGDFIAGDSTVWAQGLLNKAKLKGTDGFDSDSTGFAAGYEYNIDDSYKAGIGYAFAATDINTDRSKTKVDTHTLFAYGEYKPDAFFVNGMLGYGRSAYDEKTKLLGLQSDYKADTISVQALSGYAFEKFTPEAGIRYINVKEKAYTDALGARTAGGTRQTLTAVAGIKTAKDYRFEKGVLTVQAGASLTYDLKQSGADKTVSMANGTSYVVQGKKIKRAGLEIGAGASYKLNAKTDIGVSYEGKFKNDYTDHTGMLNIRYSF